MTFSGLSMMRLVTDWRVLDFVDAIGFFAEQSRSVDSLSRVVRIAPREDEDAPDTCPP